LRGLLHSQRLTLEEQEAKKRRDEEEIQKIKTAIENTLKKLKENGCET